MILRRFALSGEAKILADMDDVVSRAPFRHMITPGGFRMSVGMTNCGALGWVSDKTGYRYDPMDPESNLPWPLMPESFLSLAANAAAKAGFKEFAPDACLINRYAPRRKADAAPGQGRAGLRSTYRLCLAGPSRHLPVRRS